MASITKRTGANGAISYKITVSDGSGPDGKQRRHFKTWKPEPGMSERQIEKELQRAAIQFEQEIEDGFRLDERQTFKQFTEYFIDLKAAEGLADNSIMNMRRHLRILEPYIGNIKLADLKPGHISTTFKEIASQRTEYFTFSADALALAKEAGAMITDYALQIGTAQYQKVIRDKRKATRRGAESIARVFGKPVDKLFIVSTERKYCDKTIKDIAKFCSQVLDYAEFEMLIKFNPAKRARIAKGREQTTRKKFLTETEALKFLRCADVEDERRKALIYTLMYTGMRVGELCALRWNNVNFQTGQITIDHGITTIPGGGLQYGPTKTRAGRTVYMPQELLKALLDYRRETEELYDRPGDTFNGELYVFYKVSNPSEPTRPATVVETLRLFCKKHKLPIASPHVFRHTVASLLIANGADVSSTASILGHKSISTTIHTYTHAIDEAKIRATNTLAQVLQAK